MVQVGEHMAERSPKSESLRIYTLQSGSLSGIENMALDEALLEFLREQPEPTLILRTYCWEEPTLSLGVNQQVRDINFLLEFYGAQASSASAEFSMAQPQAKKSPVKAVVRRPTGGRAILHGEDISYSFITNDPLVLKCSLKESYTIYAEIVRQALQQLALAVQSADDAGERDYLRSPVCFETHTPSDLLGRDGKKLTGSAQLRRQCGLLQHGAAFLAPYGITEDTFSQALFGAAERAFQQSAEPFSIELRDAVNPGYHKLQADYAKDSGEILANVPTISGSHFEPASF